MVKLRDRLAVASIVSIAVFYPAIGEDAPTLPIENYALHHQTGSEYSWDKELSSLPYDVNTEKIHTIEQINIMHHVVSELLENAVEIEPEILQAVDEEFWALI